MIKINKVIDPAVKLKRGQGGAERGSSFEGALERGLRGKLGQIYGEKAGLGERINQRLGWNLQSLIKSKTQIMIP